MVSLVGERAIGARRTTVVTQRISSSRSTLRESGGKVAGSTPRVGLGASPMTSSSVPPLAMSA
ncbi:MAG: hypothetical protein WBE76_18340 [Terracidiphilus sp.]